MIPLTLLWVLASAAVGFLYADRPTIQLQARLVLLAIAELVSTVAIISLCVLSWHIWVVPAVLQLYRAVNVARFLRRNLPLARLNSLALRAHSWLVIVQTLLAAVSWVIHATAAGQWLLTIIIVVQLVAALVLLRSSVDTWRYTQLPAATRPLSNKELPSLSVLIPARNETVALQACLKRLIASDYPKLEIIVLDDNSTTRHTSDIIRGFAHDGVRFVQGVPPDEIHWLAKNQAYAKLRAEATGELLLFCGVDALFDTGSVRQLVQILLERKGQMMSVLPLRAPSVQKTFSLLQPMRYYWELCLPRRLFKRPPVLSTCWLVRAQNLDAAGGFEAVKHSVTPEAFFARHAVVDDSYSFLRSDSSLGIYSAKPAVDQYDTSVRVRYPQLHRRLELIALTSLIEMVVFLGPIVGLLLGLTIGGAGAYVFIWSICLLCVGTTYYIAAVSTGLNAWWLGWIIMPIAFVYDIIIQHISLFKYEFSVVTWKGRDITPTVMQVIPRLPKL